MRNYSTVFHPEVKDTRYQSLSFIASLQGYIYFYIYKLRAVANISIRNVSVSLHFVRMYFEEPLGHFFLLRVAVYAEDADFPVESLVRLQVIVRPV